MLTYFDLQTGISVETKELSYMQSFFTTFLIAQREIAHFQLHCERLIENAHHFKVKLPHQFEQTLINQLSQLTPTHESYRCRVSIYYPVDKIITASIEINPFIKEEKSYRLKLKEKKVHSIPSIVKAGDYREILELQARAIDKGFDDFLFYDSQKGNVLESSVANIIFIRDQEAYTPRLQHGILAGRMREALLEAQLLEERTITSRDIEDYQQVFLVNSLRGLIPVESIDQIKYSVKDSALIKKMRDELISNKLGLRDHE